MCLLNQSLYKEVLPIVIMVRIHVCRYVARVDESEVDTLAQMTAFCS